MRLEGAVASQFPIGAIVPANREQGTPRLLVVSIDTDGTPVGEPTRRRGPKPPAPDPRIIAEQEAAYQAHLRWRATQPAEDPQHTPDYGSLRDSGW